ncbi:MAG: glycosyltransferase family 1 protein [Bacteroidia bacterium]|nr:glycosyltransferase family 1 protein [Bacteroidia bacterium]
MNIQPLRLAIVVSHPIQYFAPVYRELAKNPSILLTVLFATRAGVDAYFDHKFNQLIQWDIPLTEGYHSVFLSSQSKKSGLQWRIVTELIQQRADVILFHGYDQPTNLLGILVAKLLRKKVLMRGDTRISPRNSKKNFKFYFKKWLFNRFDGFIAIGTLNKEYYQNFGISKNKIYFAPFCVDSNLFDIGKQKESVRARVRKELQIQYNKYVILFVAKLTDQKRPYDLLAAFANLKMRHPDAVIVYAGSGEQKQALQIEAKNKKLDVRFLGFVNQKKLPELYAASDIFVLPSDREAWGLVINEAMIAGLPVITTYDVGAAPDLVIGKGTGQVYAPGDVGALTAILDEWLSNPAKIKVMGEKAKSLISKWDVKNCAEGIIAAAIKVRERPKK